MLKGEWWAQRIVYEGKDFCKHNIFVDCREIRVSQRVIVERRDVAHKVLCLREREWWATKFRVGREYSGSQRVCLECGTGLVNLIQARI